MNKKFYPSLEEIFTELSVCTLQRYSSSNQELFTLHIINQWLSRKKWTHSLYNQCCNWFEVCWLSCYNNSYLNLPSRKVENNNEEMYSCYWQSKSWFMSEYFPIFNIFMWDSLLCSTMFWLHHVVKYQTRHKLNLELKPTLTQVTFLLSIIIKVQVEFNLKINVEEKVELFFNKSQLNYI